MRLLLATAGIGAIAVSLATPAFAQETVISTATTTPVTTSTTGDLRISSTGSIKPAGGAAVTINSNNKVKNEGTIQITGANNATGILANTNLSGDITNTGAITIDEDYTPTDTDKDGDIDGPYAQGSNRFGIHVLGGGTYTGNILNSGTITVEGNDSAGIAVDSALTGSLTHRGTISVLGDDSFGIRTSSVSGNVTVAPGSSTVVQGANSVGVLVGGDVGGAVVIQGSVSSTGYRSSTPPADPSKLDSDDLLQSGSAVVIAGDVAGGILLDRPPADSSSSDNDEDDDGILDAQETTATIVTFGSAPAMLIGSTSEAINIGAVGTTGYGLVIRGNVLGNGVYDGLSATGLAIGGTGHAVNLAGGMSLDGSISAKAAKANATALDIGAGATVPVINVTGSISALGGGTDTTSATALNIDAGASVDTIRNSGSILAGLNGTDALGTATAIVDHSGTVDLVENSGTIGVVGAAALGDRATAIDLSANTTGVTVRQIAPAPGRPTPQINGNVLLGSGNDILAIFAGSLIGNVDFGGGSDIFALGTLFRGELLNSAGVAVTVGNNAVLDVKNAGTVDLASLTAGENSSIGVNISDEGHTLYNVAGTASFGTGSKVIVSLETIAGASGTYLILDAGTLVGGNNLTSSIVTLPFLFNSSLSTIDANGQVVLDIELKEAGELGLNSSETAILDAALDAVDGDRSVAAVFLSAADAETLRGTLQQLLPEHAGGTFETVSRGSRLAADILGDSRPVARDGLGLWVQQFGWNTSKPVGVTANYKVSGWGATAGIERPLGELGTVGITGAYMGGRDTKGANDIVSNQYEGGVYWRGGFGPLRAFARAAAGSVNFNSTRNFTGTVNSATVTRSAEAEWSGRLYSGVAGLAYELRVGRLTIRPTATVDYTKLNEKGYTESGGGEALDLTVRSRNSNETGANAMLAVGYDVLGTPDSNWLRFELQGGRREVLSGSLGTTIASFGDGEPFELTPEQRSSGWRGAVRVIGGGTAVSAGAELGLEQIYGTTAVNGRVGVNLAM